MIIKLLDILFYRRSFAVLDKVIATLRNDVAITDEDRLCIKEQTVTA